MGLLLYSFNILQAEVPDSTRITYKIPARVKVNNAFTVPEKPIINTRSVINDSLKAVVIDLTTKNDSLLTIASDQEARLQATEAKVHQLSEENKNIGKELENANGDKLQSSHTSSILYIFNMLLGIILLIALMWMMSKKKFGETEKASTNGYSSNGKQEVFNTAPALDHRLERIEKLGNLRDKGLLTDEEFNLQKKQILAERN